MKLNKTKLIKNIVFLSVVLLLVILGIELFPRFRDLTTESGREVFKTEIESLGIKGAFVLIFFIIAKIVLVFLPGEPLEIVAGMCYGPFVGTVIVYIGVICTTILINKLVQKFGRSWIYDIASKEKLEKIETHIKNNPNRLEIVIFFLFFIPAVPKDLITYVGSLMPIKTSRFLMISIIARIPAILSSTIVGSQILDGTWINIAIIYGVSYSISLILGIFYKILTKNNELKKSKKTEI